MPKDNSRENPVILIDGSSYLYRAYHALPPLMSSKNQPTGAIRGVISMVKKILSDHPSSPLAVIFDANVLYTASKHSINDRERRCSKIIAKRPFDNRRTPHGS